MKTRNAKQILKVSIIVFFSLFLIFFILLNTRSISRGINLQIYGIVNGNIYKENILEVNGNAKFSKHLLVNGREININQEGDFTDSIVLLPGYNIITISAEDKFGKIKKQTFEVIREGDLLI